ncbi:MAG: hypothetical protein V3T16_10335, partial [Gemmatimonadales bacterium]
MNRADTLLARHAVIWDYDGTLVDSCERNLSVTREIITTVTLRPADSDEALVSVASYRAATVRSRNWRDLYATEFGFSEQHV